MRLNKFLSDAGYCSRRQADRLVEEGRVSVDGRTATLGEQVEEGQKVYVDGKEIKPTHRKIVLAFHKPKGIVCTTEKREKNNIIDYIRYPERIYPVGRLDKDSEGL
ncbi:MAG: 23S rRNA pseudouridine synthase F, partial [Eubacterium sp.]|nr:23S rRNA pseudouridine synthase F [Eubacterium sp.]